jgi:hypothetical protein
MVRGEQRAAEVARSIKAARRRVSVVVAALPGNRLADPEPADRMLRGRARKDGPRAAQAFAGPLRICEVCAELSGECSACDEAEKAFQGTQRGSPARRA